MQVAFAIIVGYCATRAFLDLKFLDIYKIQTLVMLLNSQDCRVGTDEITD